MTWEQLRARALGEEHTPRRCPITGLLPAEQDARNEQVAHWIARIEQVMKQTGCSAGQALRAIEQSNEAQ